MLKTIQTMESREASKAKAIEMANVLDGIKLKEAIRVVRERCAETPTYTEFPRKRSRRIRANNATERLNLEIRRRLRAVGRTARAPSCSSQPGSSTSQRAPEALAAT